MVSISNPTGKGLKLKLKLTALLSLSDKTNLVPLAKVFVDCGVQLVASGDY